MFSDRPAAGPVTISFCSIVESGSKQPPIAGFDSQSGSKLPHSKVDPGIVSSGQLPHRFSLCLYLQVGTHRTGFVVPADHNCAVTPALPVSGQGIFLVNERNEGWVIASSISNFL
jgi:hypothetical protein